MEVVLANPKKTRAIAEARLKNDKVDARTLADLLRADLVAPSYVPPKEIRELRNLIRHRMNLVRDRTRLKNRVHALPGTGTSSGSAEQTSSARRARSGSGP